MDTGPMSLDEALARLEAELKLSQLVLLNAPDSELGSLPVRLMTDEMSALREKVDFWRSWIATECATRGTEASAS